MEFTAAESDLSVLREMKESKKKSKRKLALENFVIETTFLNKKISELERYAESLKYELEARGVRNYVLSAIDSLEAAKERLE